MTKLDLLIVFQQAGITQPPVLQSTDYDPVELEFVGECWDVAVKNLPVPMQNMVDVGGGKMLMVPKYVQPVFNCAKFTGWLGTYIDLCLTAVAIVKQTTPNTPAFGALDYYRGGDPAQGHSINWFVDGNSILRFFEPQLRQEVQLTDVELKSVFFVVDT